MPKHKTRSEAAHLEIWKPIPTWDRLYEVSDRGRVRSVRRVGTVPLVQGVCRAYGGKVVASFTQRNGYLFVNLTAPGIRKQVSVHRAVLLAFVGEPPNGFQACHNDGNKANNALENLRWDSPTGNHADKRLHGTLPCGEASRFAKLTEEAVRRIRAGEATKIICAEYGVGRSQVCRIRRGQSWAHLK